MTGVRVLCAEPNPSGTAAALDAAGIPTIESDSLDSAKEQLDDNDVSCVVTEDELPDGSGMEFVDYVRETAPDTPCVLFTETPPSDLDTTHFEGLIVEYLRKSAPEASDRLGMVVQDMLDHRSQVGYLLPDDEDARLDALDRYEIEDADFEETCDRISTLVANHFDVPVAFVGFVEREEENFVACHGADWETINREDTICTHTILEEDVMVVEDITSDHRFQNNDTLLSLGIRSYAGANFEGPDGHTLGSLCLIDYEPREYDAEQRADLQRFADEVTEQLDLRNRLLEGGQ